MRGSHDAVLVGSLESGKFLYTQDSESVNPEQKKRYESGLRVQLTLHRQEILQQLLSMFLRLVYLTCEEKGES